MITVSVNQFRDNLKAFVERCLSEHEPLRVTRRSGEDFVVMSAEDWEREQETLYVLQNTRLMEQIAESMRTHGECVLIDTYCPCARAGKDQAEVTYRRSASDTASDAG